MSRLSVRSAAVIAILGAAMIVTRGGVFGSAVGLHLHDASWAVFLLAGLMIGRWWALAALGALALAVDLAALCGGALADPVACLRPSYSALPVAWLLMFVAGRWLAYAVSSQTLRLGWFGAVGIVAASTTLAYALTSGAFYLWSGFFDGVTITAFAAQSLPFAVRTAAYTLLYTTLIAGAFRLARQRIVVPIPG